MSRLTTTTTALSQNGMRQPQVSSCSSGSAPIGRNTAVAMMRPAWVPPSVKLVKNARRWSSACSRLSAFAPACSPEAERPWMSRSATSSAGAQRPMESYVGRQPTRNVDSPMSETVSRSTRLRPYLSPRCPMKKAPIGRAT